MDGASCVCTCVVEFSFLEMWAELVIYTTIENGSPHRVPGHTKLRSLLLYKHMLFTFGRGTLHWSTLYSIVVHIHVYTYTCIYVHAD